MLQIILIVTYIRGLHLTPMQLNAAGTNKITVVEFQPANAWFILFSTVPRIMCYSHSYIASEILLIRFGKGNLPCLHLDLKALAMPSF